MGRIMLKWYGNGRKGVSKRLRVIAKGKRRVGGGVSMDRKGEQVVMREESWDLRRAITILPGPWAKPAALSSCAKIRASDDPTNPR